MNVKEAERTVASLEQKHTKCVARGTELADERANVALAAHTGDAAAVCMVPMPDLSKSDAS